MAPMFSSKDKAIPMLHNRESAKRKKKREFCC